MLLKQCRRCNCYIRYPNRYCSKCLSIIEQEKQCYDKENKKERDKKYNRKRDKKYINFYNSSDWKKLSRQYMIDVGYKCEGEKCNKIASEVHHKISIQTPEGWLRRLDYFNLKAVCIDCHNKEHNRFRSRKGKR